MGNMVGSVTGDVAGNKASAAKFEKAAASLPANTKFQGGGRTFQAKGNFAKDLKNKAKHLKGKIPNGRQAKSIAGLAIGAAAGGYAAKKLSHSVASAVSEARSDVIHSLSGRKRKK